MQVESTMVVERDGDEITLTIIGDYDPGDPGQLYGPPEKCWPAEPACVDLHLILKDGQPWDCRLTPAEEMKAEEILLQSVQEVDDPEPESADYDDF